MADEKDLEEMKKRIRQDLDALDRDIRSFCGTYESNRECWQGEAADEEGCFISADKESLGEMIDELRRAVASDEAGR